MIEWVQKWRLFLLQSLCYRFQIEAIWNIVWSIVSKSSRLEKCILCRGGVSNIIEKPNKSYRQIWNKRTIGQSIVECALLANCTTKNLPLFINTLSSDQTCFYFSCIWKNRKFSSLLTQIHSIGPMHFYFSDRTRIKKNYRNNHI